MNFACLQNIAKHAEPAAEEVSQRIEEGAHTFAANAGPATKELTDRAVDAAHDVAKQAKPTADEVCPYAIMPCVVRIISVLIEHSCWEYTWPILSLAMCIGCFRNLFLRSRLEHAHFLYTRGFAKFC